MSGRDSGQRAGDAVRGGAAPWNSNDPEINVDSYFAQLMSQLEACGCGPMMASDDGAALGEQEQLPPACGPVLENIAEMLDHVMPDELERLMLEHSAHCDQCGPAVDAEIRLRELVRRSCAEQAPESLRLRVTTLTAKYHN